jgi:hypothetical protein
LYAYSRTNPINYLDPIGLDYFGIGVSLSGGAGGGGSIGFGIYFGGGGAGIYSNLGGGGYGGVGGSMTLDITVSPGQIASGSSTTGSVGGSGGPPGTTFGGAQIIGGSGGTVLSGGVAAPGSTFSEFGFVNTTTVVTAKDVVDMFYTPPVPKTPFGDPAGKRE